MQWTPGSDEGLLARGCCRYSVHPGTTVSRGSKFEGSYDCSARLFQVQLISFSNAVQVCRLDGTSRMPGKILRQPMTLRWDRAATLMMIGLGSTNDFVDHMINSMILMPTFALCKGNCRIGHQSWAHLLPIEQAYCKGKCFVGVFKSPPIIPRSVTLSCRIQTSNELSESLLHLRLARLKRQICGLCFIYRDSSATTKFSIVSGDFQDEVLVESVELFPGSIMNAGLFLLTPATRITVLDVEVKDSQKPSHPNNVSTSDSAAFRVLKRSIDVMGRYQDADIPRFFLLSGRPGVGKTHAVRSVMQVSQVPIFSEFVLGSCSTGLSGIYETPGLRLQKVFLKLQKESLRQVCVLFLDELDALISSQHSVAVLGHQLDQIHSSFKRIIVVAATNRIDSIPVSLRRSGRFESALVIPNPSVEQRKGILKSLLGEKSVHLDEIAELSVGYVPADLYSLVRQANVLSWSNLDSIEVNLRKAMRGVRASALRDSLLAKPPVTTWDCVAGDPGGAKTALNRSIEWPVKKKYKFQCLGLDPPRGILLHGPPGCAKTTLARAASGSQKIAFVSLSPADVFKSSYVGDAEATLRQAFATARATAPCILFLDEIDSILGSENGGASHQMSRTYCGSSAESRVLSTFLNETDGLTSITSDQVLVIGATNRPSTLDAALLRPGRFDKIIFVPPPDVEGRVAIIEKQLQVFTGIESTGLDVHRLASDDVSGQLTGAEIVGVCREFVMKYLLERLVSAEALSSSSPFANLENMLRAKTPMLCTPGAMDEFTRFEHNKLCR